MTGAVGTVTAYSRRLPGCINKVTEGIDIVGWLVRLIVCLFVWLFAGLLGLYGWICSYFDSALLWVR